MRTTTLIFLACALAGASLLAPTAAADLVIGFDRTGDRDCDDAGETTTVGTPEVQGREVVDRRSCSW